MRGPIGGGMLGGTPPGIVVPITPALLWNTGAPVFAGVAPNQYWNADTSATVEITTSDTHLTIEVVADPVYNTLGIFVNGVFNQIVTYAVFNVKTSLTITLPAGANKRVQISSFCHVTSVTTTGTVLPAPATVANRMVTWGDSIPAGYFSTGEQLGYISNQIRHSGRFEGVTNFSISGDAVFVHPPATIAAALVARFADVAPAGEKILYIEMGTNDFGQQNIGFSTAAAFATSLGQIVDAVHASDPTIKIRVQSLFDRSFKGPNSFGSTWADFNNAISGVVATRQSFCVLMIGQRAFTVAQTTDGLHPNDAGHASAAAWWLAQDSLILTNPVTIIGAANLIAGYSVAFSIPQTTGLVDISNHGQNLAGTQATAAAALNGYDCAQYVAANTNGVQKLVATADNQVVYVYAILRVDVAAVFSTLLTMGALNNDALIQGHFPGAPNVALFNNGTFGPETVGGLTVGAFKRVYYAFTGSAADKLLAGSVAAGPGPSAGALTGRDRIEIGAGNGSFSSMSFAEAYFSKVSLDSSLAALDAYALAQWGFAP